MFQNYVGQLELAQSKEESVRIVQQGRPLLYHIRFPLRQPIPLLTGIWFNDQQYCSGPRGEYLTVLRDNINIVLIFEITVTRITHSQNWRITILQFFQYQI